MDDRRPLPLNRRQFLAATVAAALAAACGGDDDAPASTSATTTTTGASGGSTTTAAGSASTTTTAAPLELPSSPFNLGVASGDPTADSVILWTRLAYPPVDGIGLPGADIPVDWELATDESFADIVASGTESAVSALGYSVHVDAGGLDADGTYYYRFSTAGYTSPVGRTRTFAAAGESPELFRFAFTSCQNWQGGQYAAWRDIAAIDSLDAIVFLGDYIYEYADGGYDSGLGRGLDGAGETITLDDYRNRYAVYKGDPNLQAAHHAAPWIGTWDDHEVDNDYASATAEDDAPEAEFLERRAAAYQAWYEHMPVRLDPPDGPDFAIYRTVGHGDLVAFHVLDTRQYRDDQASGGIELGIAAVGSSVQQLTQEILDADRQMLGAEQESWLIGTITESGAVWDVLAQQVFMFGASVVPGQTPPFVVVDTWDGYATARRRLLEALSADGVVDNLVVLTGDFHSAAVGDLRIDPFDPSGPVVGTEFMASAVSSQFFDGAVELATAALAANPQVKFFSGRNGYCLCEVTPQSWNTQFRAVVDVIDPDSAVETIAAWQVSAGTPGATAVG